MNHVWGRGPQWHHLTPADTRAGAPLGINRPLRVPFIWAMIAATAIAAAVILIFGAGRGLGSGLFFGLGLAWSAINASETDANSPLNQTLMDKIRENLDYLHSFAGNVQFYKGGDANSGGTDPLTITVSAVAERDWRDRVITVLFGIINTGQAGDINVNYLPGGTRDLSLHTQRGESPPVAPDHSAADSGNWNGAAIFKAESFYSANGSAAYTSEPYIISTVKKETGVTEAYIWVDTSGNLKLTINFGAGYKGCAYILEVLFSEDQGGH